jgi:hypothetical protein
MVLTMFEAHIHAHGSFGSRLWAVVIPVFKAEGHFFYTTSQRL